MEGGAPTGTDRRHAQQLLARLWAVLDPAVDALPAGEVLEHVLARLIEHFGVTAAALRLDSGERFGTHAGDPAWPAAAERLELEVQDGLGAIGTLELAFPDPGQRTQEERATLELAAARPRRSPAARARRR